MWAYIDMGEELDSSYIADGERGGLSRLLSAKDIIS